MTFQDSYHSYFRNCLYNIVPVSSNKIGFKISQIHTEHLKQKKKKKKVNKANKKNRMIAKTKETCFSFARRISRSRKQVSNRLRGPIGKFRRIKSSSEHKSRSLNVSFSFLKVARYSPSCRTWHTSSTEGSPSSEALLRSTMS